MVKPKIHFTQLNKSLEIGNCSTVLDVALGGGVELGHSCGGNGSCGTCRIIIESDLNALPERTELEQEMADARGFARHERLACQLDAIAGLKVRLPDQPRTKKGLV